ncbi:TetR/AcrR family transcriptional regulator [Bacillus sp. FJAT-49870]|uniref:TetR/AcrR family transcriptional regulator n=1 Tax=Lederbergia citri TaxID=2833580 RepID=A0A942THG5_9BACI|nr:TetR/AcrR family transcriptional regulator [Lederbergia citri]
MYPDNRVIKTKERVKKSLLTLLNQKNFNDITIMDIVKLAKINRGTFYNHYKNKEQLLNEIVDEIMADLIHSYRSPYQSNKKLKISDISPSTVKLFDHVYKNYTFYSSIVNSDMLPTFQHRLCLELCRLALYDVRISNPKINSNLYASYTAFATGGMLIEWVRGGFKYSPDYMAKQLVEILNISPNQIMVER